jgi:hypothetical protein
MEQDIDALLEPKFKSKFIEKLINNASFEWIPLLDESPHCTAKELSEESLRKSFMRLLEGMTPNDKKALADVLESDCSHSEVYEYARKALLSHSITKKRHALSILSYTSRAGFDRYAIENIIRFFIKNSNGQKKCKEERLGDCDGFWWDLDAKAFGLKSSSIPYAEFPEKNFPVYGKPVGDAESSPKLKMAISSETKEALKTASKLAATMATQEKNALEIVATSVMFAYITAYKSLIDDQFLEEKREFYLEHIRYLFSQPALWSDLSETLASVSRKAATKLGIGRMEALQIFSGICIVHGIPQKKNIRFSRSTDFYAIASNYLKGAGDLHKFTFENDFKKAYGIVKAKVKS